MEYLRPRQRLKEKFRASIKRESMADLRCKENANASRNDGSETVLSERIMRQKKSWFNYELYESSVQNRGSNRAKTIVDKEKVQWLKASRDYSFLSSDDDKFQKSVIKPVPRMVKNASKYCVSMPKKTFEESRKGKPTPKPPLTSSKTQSKESGFKNSGRSNLEGEVRKRKYVIYDDEDDDDTEQATGIIRRVFRYDPKKFGDDADDRNMEATFSDIQMEETRSAKIARKEDAQEHKRIEEQEKRKTKKRKMN
ncbi:SPT2 chromatin protein [Abeliophyllum distichum]|uniref:SPT2 chromatin protein n=1 Tax=Abeliophyllum distichum TaxID=126358 RepID=A0ABD1PRD0_9LAMI